MFLLKLESQPDLILFMHVVGTVLLTVIAVYLHQHQGDNKQHYHHYIGKHHSSFQGNPIKNYNFIYINITYIHIWWILYAIYMHIIVILWAVFESPILGDRNTVSWIKNNFLESHLLFAYSSYFPLLWSLKFKQCTHYSIPNSTPQVSSHLINKIKNLCKFN